MINLDDPKDKLGVQLRDETILNPGIRDVGMNGNKWQSFLNNSLWVVASLIWTNLSQGATCKNKFEKINFIIILTTKV